MIMAVCLMASAMMIEAFAARSVSGSVAGYSVSVTLSMPESDQFLVHVSSGERMIHSVSSTATFKNRAGTDSETFTVFGDYNGWDCNHYHYSRGYYTSAYNASGIVDSVYNGQSARFNVFW